MTDISGEGLDPSRILEVGRGYWLSKTLLSATPRRRDEKRGDGVENIIDDARRENLYGLMMSLNILIAVDDGFDYTGADFSD